MAKTRKKRLLCESKSRYLFKGHLPLASKPLRLFCKNLVTRNWEWRLKGPWAAFEKALSPAPRKTAAMLSMAMTRTGGDAWAETGIEKKRMLLRIGSGGDGTKFESVILLRSTVFRRDFHRKNAHSPPKTCQFLCKHRTRLNPLHIELSREVFRVKKSKMKLNPGEIYIAHTWKKCVIKYLGEDRYDHVQEFVKWFVQNTWRCVKNTERQSETEKEQHAAQLRKCLDIWNTGMWGVRREKRGKWNSDRPCVSPLFRRETTQHHAGLHLWGQTFENVS